MDGEEHQGDVEVNNHEHNHDHTLKEKKVIISYHLSDIIEPLSLVYVS